MGRRRRGGRRRRERFLFGGSGADALDGGKGDDVLRAAESPPEADAVISCGAGTEALVEDDGVDILPDDCETLDPPQLDGPLVITGEPRVGNVLSLSIPTNVGGGGEVRIEWQVCDAAGYACAYIGGANDATYTPTRWEQGSRLRALYSVRNGLGYDAVASQATEIIGPAIAAPPPTRQPRPPRPPRRSSTAPRPPVAAQRLVLGPFRIGRKPSLVVRNGRPAVDTGRSIRCPAAFGVPCQLSATARPSGVTARLRGRPGIAGAIQAQVASGTWHKLVVPINHTAYRLLRAHDKLTLSVTATFTRLGNPPLRKTFTITVKAPARGGR